MFSPKCCLSKSSTTQTQSREKMCCPSAGTLCGLPALGREGQELLPDADWPLAQSVSEGSSGLGVLLTQFLGCTKQAPGAGTAGMLFVGSVARLCTGPGSSPPQTVTPCPSRAGQALAVEPFVPCCAQVRVWGPCGLCPTGNTSCSSPGTGASSQPALNGEIGIGIQPGWFVGHP